MCTTQKKDFLRSTVSLTHKNMLKDVVLSQKLEKERLLSSQYVERTKTGEARKWIDSDLIKVVLGPRRAGKSVFSSMLLKDRPFAYFNFDDESIQGTFNYNDLIKELHFVYGKTKNLFFDEIQNLPNWELFVSRLHRLGYNLILTGSNARLLSKELATALTGRHIPIEIFPFDFNEFLRAKNYQISDDNLRLPEGRALLLGFLEKFLLDGGYPEAVVKNLDIRDYLSTLYDSLLFKDVVKRHKVKFSRQIDSLGSYLINNAASFYSLRKLTNILSLKSDKTLEKYFDYLTEAYAVFTLGLYSPKVGERIKSPRKVYVVDNGLISAKAVSHSPDTGKLMENLVFMELVKRGFAPHRDLFYYKTRNAREVDFAIKKGTKIDELVQVVYQMGSLDTERREVKALVEAADELGVKKMTILTWDENREIRENGLTVRVVSLLEWMGTKT